MNAPSVCPTHHEDDTPADADHFGVHARIARTIAQVVEQTAGGKTIGLSGTWGAGKSTVVRLLQVLYADRPESRVVWTFDAWAHEGDPLRRTFLESLIATLAERGWLVSSEWHNTLEFLSKRRKVTQRHSAPRLTPMGVLVAVSVLLVPVGTTLFSNQIRSGIILRWGPPDWLALLGLLLALGPLLALIGWAAWVTIRPSAAGTGWRDELMNALTVFIQRTDTDSYTETLDSGDPTSLEFEANFRGIMSAALGNHPDRRLVLVIDNLDRVGAPQALAVWSTLQTFLQRRGQGGWIDQVWCLLPFDADAIRRLWQKDSAPGNPIAESFLDKTFQLRFDVPLPRLANWKDYLVAALGRALPEHTATDEFFRIYRLYSVRRSANWIAPTPRQLKLFVNQVGSLHRQWQHEIPLEDLAYYVLLQGEQVPIVSSLLTGALPAPAEAGLVSARARDSLAALVYGSKVEESHELLLRQPILDALEAADATRLADLARISDKFWLVLELAIEQGCQEWPLAEGGLVLHAAVALDGAGIAGLESPWRLAALFRRLASAVRAIQAWAPMDSGAVNGAIVMARHAPDLVARLHDGFTQVRFVQVEKMAAAEAHAFADDYVRLCRGLGGVRPPRPLTAHYDGTYIELARSLAVADADGTTWTHFLPDNASGFVTALCTRQPSSSDWGSVVRVAVTAGVSGWNELIAKARKGLIADEGYTPADVLEMLGAVHALADVAKNDDAAKLLGELTDPIAFGVDPRGPAERALLLALAAVDAPEGAPARVTDADALGAWLYTLLAIQGTLSGVGHPRRELDPSADRARQWVSEAVLGTKPELTQALAKATYRFGEARTLFKVARDVGGWRAWVHDRPLMILVLEALGEMGAPPRILPPALVIDEWDASFPSWSRYDVVKAMRSRRQDISDALLNAPPGSRLASAYAGALDASESGDEQLLAMCASYLLAVSPEDWRAALSGGEMGLPRLHAAIARRRGAVTLSPDVRSVLRQFVTNPPADQWTDPVTAAAIMGTFDAAEREEVIGQAVDAFARLAEAHKALPARARATLSQAHLLAAFAGGALLDRPRLAAHPGLFAAVTAYVLANRKDDRLAQVSELARRETALTEGLGSEERQALLDLIKGRQSDGSSEDTRELLAVLAETLANATPPDAARVERT